MTGAVAGVAVVGGRLFDLENEPCCRMVVTGYLRITV